MKTTHIDFLKTGVALTMVDPPETWPHEDRGSQCLTVTLPDGSRFRYADLSGAEFEDVVELSGRDGVWKAEWSFIPTDPNSDHEGDQWESDPEGYPTRAAALADGMSRARELGVPLIEVSWPEKRGGGRILTCLWQPLQVIVRDRLGGVTFNVCGEKLVSAYEGLSDEAERLAGIVVTDGMSSEVLSGLVHEAWGAVCEVVVRSLPVRNPAVVGVLK